MSTFLDSINNPSPEQAPPTTTPAQPAQSTQPSQSSLEELFPSGAGEIIPLGALPEPEPVAASIGVTPATPLLDDLFGSQNNPFLTGEPVGLLPPDAEPVHDPATGATPATPVEERALLSGVPTVPDPASDVTKPRKKMLKGDLLVALEKTDVRIMALEKERDAALVGLEAAQAGLPSTITVASAPAHQPNGFTVYVGCAPVKAAYQTLYDILPKLEEQARTAVVRERLQGRPDDDDDYVHYLLTPFSRGPSLVAALLQEQLPSLSGNIVVDSFHPAGSVCLAVLLANKRCIDVVRPNR